MIDRHVGTALVAGDKRRIIRRRSPDAFRRVRGGEAPDGVRL